MTNISQTNKPKLAFKFFISILAYCISFFLFAGFLVYISTQSKLAGIVLLAAAVYNLPIITLLERKRYKYPHWFKAIIVFILFVIAFAFVSPETQREMNTKQEKTALEGANKIKNQQEDEVANEKLVLAIENLYGKNVSELEQQYPEGIKSKTGKYRGSFKIEKENLIFYTEYTLPTSPDLTSSDKPNVVDYIQILLPVEDCKNNELKNGVGIVSSKFGIDKNKLTNKSTNVIGTDFWYDYKNDTSLHLGCSGSGGTKTFSVTLLTK